MANKGIASVFVFYCNFYEIEKLERAKLEPRFRNFWRKDSTIYDFALLSKYEDMIETLTDE